MAGWKDPIGSKPKGVYVRRRIFVLLALLALAAAVVLIVLKPGSSTEAATTPEVEMPDDLVAAEQAESERDDAETSPCGNGQLKVLPITDRNSYAAGELPQLSLSIENVGDEACAADVGTAGMVLTITSGSDEVWRSTDCQKNADHRSVILEPGEPLVTEPLAWDRTRSSTETCEISRDSVTAGGASYHLRAEAAGVQGTGSVQFLLY